MNGKLHKNILIAGGSGMIGSILSRKLQALGYQVAWLSRNSKSDADYKIYQWNIQNESLSPEALEWADVVINLAGATIARWPWTNSYKKKVIRSRTEPAKLIAAELKYISLKPKIYISASATGIYGDRKEEIHTESSVAGKDFLSRSCLAWEENAISTGNEFSRSAIVRTGIVLSNLGGFLEKLTLPAKLNLLAVPGNGNQWLPWIHIDDLCRIYISIIENETMHGVYNAASPNPVTLNTFCSALCKTLGTSLWLPAIPDWVLKLFLGEMSQIILDSVRVNPEKLLAENFEFQFVDAELALKDLLTKK